MYFWTTKVVFIIHMIKNYLYKILLLFGIPRVFAEYCFLYSKGGFFPLMISSLILDCKRIVEYYWWPYVDGQLDQHTFPCKAVPCQSGGQSTGETTEQQKSLLSSFVIHYSLLYCKILLCNTERER